ncbi:Spx/MgsR family RNA polymerase-binding regulatory protein [Vreelandella rituensis]|uniref:ArsC family reductase n=1 Tax=Vreelandella rituensis TaxID=2282306 RepID=A0A368U7E3_9GAMM|nr:Spx/MgsR family RNA polymerase-binding regulatory protein [Halomonas rituensis]RCV92864.1 ArsC family reductase [Halomonas rituensis]
MLTLYMIKNCDTCRKALKALDSRGIPFKTHDLREDGLSAALLEHILHRVPLVEVLNKRSKTWRDLPQADKDTLDSNSARQLIMQYPTLLKRPLLENGNEIRVGYREGDYDDLKG